MQACQQEFVIETICRTQPTHPKWAAECPSQLCRARRAARLGFRLPGVFWHEILPSLSYGTAKSEQVEIFPGCLPQASLVLLGVDFSLGFSWFGGGCLGLFCIVSIGQNSSTIAKEKARESTSYPRLKEINCVILEITVSGI